ncbi:DNA replication ATP-dependent helicase/nuclease JHS1-like [Lolium perenne]|uniref:DNA replication ATP-dependent helicase/nuclease JHS1-like n=1 Tax=Lolium perenne TaxID=4522 RepID=UPI003A995AA6
MLINQSHDDGGGEVITWKISPVNDRLRTRHLPGMALHPCSNNEKHSSLEAMKKWHSSPLGLSRCTASARNPNACGIGPGGCDGMEDTQSPFRTPPSLPYSTEQLTAGINGNGGPDLISRPLHPSEGLNLVSWSSSQQLLLPILNDHIATRVVAAAAFCSTDIDLSTSVMPCTEPSAASHRLQFTRFHNSFTLEKLQEQEAFRFFVISTGKDCDRS